MVGVGVASVRGGSRGGGHKAFGVAEDLEELCFALSNQGWKRSGGGKKLFA